MRHSLSILAFLFATLTLCGQTPSELATQADESYRAADYPAAISGYEAVLAGGMCSADLYYNLGNAYYRTGEIGLAILNYERALRLKPNMRDAKENLALANSKTVDRIAELPQLFVVRWIDLLCTTVTPAVWRTIWLVVLALVGLAVVLFRLGRTVALRKTGLVGGIIIVLFLFVTTLLLVSSTKRHNARSAAIVVEQAVSVKGSPEQQSVDKLLLHEGTRVEIKEQLSGWYKIRIADGTTGWCEAQAIERI